MSGLLSALFFLYTAHLSIAVATKSKTDKKNKTFHESSICPIPWQSKCVNQLNVLLSGPQAVILGVCRCIFRISL